MNLLLAADEYCCCYNGDYYVSETGLTHINRYLRAFDCVCVAFRTKFVNSEDNLGKYSNRICDKKISFIPVPFFQGPKQFATKYFSVIKSLKRGINDCDFAILRLPSTTAFAALSVARKRKIPYATEIVFDCQDAAETSESFLSKTIWRILHKMQVKACREALGVSCVTAQYLQKRYFPIRKGSITSHYSSIELTPDFFKCERKYPQKDIVTLVHVANQVQFHSRKGHNELIDVISLINKQNKRARIVFVGEDYDGGIALLTRYAENLGVAEDVHFTGYLSKRELRKQLENADIAVLPTRAEGLPRVVIEAMALGLPCITSPVSGNPELINKDFLVRYDDIEGMTKACNTLIDSKEIYERESRSNFIKSKEYSSEVLNPRRTEFYKSLIQLTINNSI